MSLLPFDLVDNFYGRPSLMRPSRLMDQHFGHSLDPADLLSPILDSTFLRTPVGYIRPWRSALSKVDAGSTLAVYKDTFTASLDVQQFLPEEISVKVSDNTLIVEGKHEDKEDEHGFISRHFVRRYVLPRDCDIDKIESKLSTDGVLTISAPRKSDEEKGIKSIPIVKTSEPAKIQPKKDEGAEQKKTPRKECLKK